MGTVEKVLLPRHSNCSYNWRSFNNEKVYNMALIVIVYTLYFRNFTYPTVVMLDGVMGSLLML